MTLNVRSLLMLICSSVSVLAVDLPYVLKRSITVTDTDSAGNVMRERRVVEQEMRSSAGSKLNQYDGTGQYTVFVAPELATYTVRQQDRVAVKQVQIPREAWRHTGAEDRMKRAANAIGTKVIAGLTCHVFPLRSNIPGFEGTICHALAEDIVLEEVRITPRADGSKNKVTETVTELRLGTEPDGAQMQVPQGYAVEDRSARPDGCASCPRK